MKTTLLHEVDGLRTFAVTFGTGENPVDGLLGVARDESLTASELTGIGAFASVDLGYFDWDDKDYRTVPVTAQVELVSLLGNIALTDEGEPKLHAHVVVADSTGAARGGHLLGGIVRPTLEVVITESPQHLRRRVDPETGLPLLPS